VTKAEFVDLLARDNRFSSKKEAAEALEAVLEAVGGVLGRGESITFTGFGKFSVSERSARQGVNPRTKERITIPAGRVPKFAAGAALKARVRA
jgi:DNA-binding protein HU-beta